MSRWMEDLDEMAELCAWPPQSFYKHTHTHMYRDIEVDELVYSTMPIFFPPKGVPSIPTLKLLLLSKSQRQKLLWTT